MSNISPLNARKFGFLELGIQCHLGFLSSVDGAACETNKSVQRTRVHQGHCQNRAKCTSITLSKSCQQISNPFQHLLCLKCPRSPPPPLLFTKKTGVCGDMVKLHDGCCSRKFERPRFGSYH